MSILFVCTGNICRSPMAEYVARSLVSDDEFASAGTFAMDGNAAWRLAIQASDEFGIDLRPHRARQLTGQIVEDASAIYALDYEHVGYLGARFPAAGVDLLDPGGAGIPDPYGSELTAVSATFQAVEEAVRSRFLSP